MNIELTNLRLIRLSTFYDKSGYVNMNQLIKLIDCKQRGTGRRYMQLLKELKGGTILKSKHLPAILINDNCEDRIYGLLIQYFKGNGITASKYKSLNLAEKSYFNKIKNYYVTTND
jgi:hypothetical protein